MDAFLTHLCCAYSTTKTGKLLDGPVWPRIAAFTLERKARFIASYQFTSLPLPWRGESPPLTILSICTAALVQTKMIENVCVLPSIFSYLERKLAIRSFALEFR